MTYEDLVARQESTVRAERIHEIMAGNPDYDPKQAGRVARQQAERFSGGRVLPVGGKVHQPKGD